MATKKKAWEAVSREGANQHRTWKGEVSRKLGEPTRCFPPTPDRREKDEDSCSCTSFFDARVDGRDDGDDRVQNHTPPLISNRDVFGDTMEVEGADAQSCASFFDDDGDGRDDGDCRFQNHGPPLITRREIFGDTMEVAGADATTQGGHAGETRRWVDAAWRGETFGANNQIQHPRQGSAESIITPRVVRAVSMCCHAHDDCVCVRVLHVQTHAHKHTSTRTNDRYELQQEQ